MIPASTRAGCRPSPPVPYRPRVGHVSVPCQSRVGYMSVTCRLHVGYRSVTCRLHVEHASWMPAVAARRQRQRALGRQQVPCGNGAVARCAGQCRAGSHAQRPTRWWQGRRRDSSAGRAAHNVLVAHLVCPLVDSNKSGAARVASVVLAVEEESLPRLHAQRLVKHPKDLRLLRVHTARCNRRRCNRKSSVRGGMASGAAHVDGDLTARDSRLFCSASGPPAPASAVASVTRVPLRALLRRPLPLHTLHALHTGPSCADFCRYMRYTRDA